MPTYLVTTERHHSSDMPACREIVDAANERQALLAGVHNALYEMCQDFSEDDLPAIDSALTALEGQEEARLTTRQDDDPSYFVLYADTGDGVAIGETNKEWLSPDKRQVRWVSVRKWRPDAAERQQLLALSKEELADQLLRLRATS